MWEALPPLEAAESHNVKLVLKKGRFALHFSVYELRILACHYDTNILIIKDIRKFVLIFLVFFFSSFRASN